MQLGIDLGTTNSAVAYVGSDGRPSVAANGAGGRLTPSLISFVDGDVWVGEQARALQRAGIGETAAFFKRFMGDRDWRFEAGNRSYDATELSGLLLRFLKRDAELHLGRPVRKAVITVPAYFMNVQREATRAAAEEADLEVIQLVNEPTAAAIAYGFSHGRVNAGKRLLVYDLGGGTFDVSLVAVSEEAEIVVRSDGDHQLGGKDWDDRLAALLAERLRSDHGIEPDGAADSELRIAAEDVKKRLSSQHRARVAIPALGRTYLIEIERSAFEAATADLLERTDLLVSQVLAESEWSTADLDGVVAVGGSTRMPSVAAYLARLTGRAPLAGVNVDEAVALGAAILADRRNAAANLAISARRVEDVTSHSLGMIAVDETAERYINSIILPKGTRTPSGHTRPYRLRTHAGGRNTMEVFVTQGEHESPAEVDFVGRYLVGDVPHNTAGPVVIDVGYAYNEGGEISVTATLRGGASLTVRRDTIGADLARRFMEPPPKSGSALAVVLTFDLSGSMAGDPLEQAKAAARVFVERVDLASSAIGVAAVADRTQVLLPPSQNARLILDAIDGLKVGSVGIGNAAHPFDKVGEVLAKVKADPVIVVLADGVWENETRAIAAARALHVNGMAIVAVGFGGANRAFLKAIASTDEASFFTDLSGLVSAFESIAQVLTEGGITTGLHA